MLFIEKDNNGLSTKVFSFIVTEYFDQDENTFKNLIVFPENETIIEAIVFSFNKIFSERKDKKYIVRVTSYDSTVTTDGTLTFSSRVAYEV